MDFSELTSLLERWRKSAVLQSDPERFARVARRAADLSTGRYPVLEADLARVWRPGGIGGPSCRRCRPQARAGMYELVTYD